MRGRIRTAITCILVILVSGSIAPGLAQELLVPDGTARRLILQETSGDAAYEHIRFMTRYHRPRGGSDGLWQVARYVEQKAREFGLSDVKLIKQPSTTRPWNARFADLWVVKPEPERLASTLQTPLHLADYSRSADVTTELVDIGAGTPKDYEGTNVAGKIVLTRGSLFQAMREAVCERGAAGVVWYPDPLAPDAAINGAGLARPDQLRWLSIPSGTIGDCEPTFAFGLSSRQGVALSARLAAASSPVVVHAVVDAEFSSQQGDEPWQVMVEAFIPGAEPGLGQDIVLTAHLQEEGFSANDDASGSASALEVARALNRLIADGRIPRPRRNIRFWWVTEISSERQYFADHPAVADSIWVNVNQDMVGADQSQDVMRKQNVTRLPAARFHFFNDVVESVVEYMVAANTAELAQVQAGHRLYPAAHLAHLGSLQRYNAEMVFFHTNTDHLTFLEAPIGVPGVTFTNMPDRFIHSSDDDLWNIDRTQLGRNAAAVALIAYTMAAAAAEDLPSLAATTLGRGMERMGRNLRLGLEWIATRADPSAYLDAVDQIRYAAERERMALGSLPQVDPAGADHAERLVRLVRQREEQALRELETAYRLVTGERRLPPRRLSETERQLAALRPRVTAGPKKFLDGRRRVRSVPGLHGLMAFEVLNAVDGARTGLDIYRYVAAEAREAGAYYYGTVTPEAVLQYLGNLEAAGLIASGT